MYFTFEEFLKGWGIRKYFKIGKPVGVGGACEISSVVEVQCIGYFLELHSETDEKPAGLFRG